MEDVMNEYELLAPFQNKNAGFSRWTYAVKDKKAYFLKEFLNPVYPMGDSISEIMQKQRIKDCEEYQQKKKRLYEAINRASDGNMIRIHEFFRCDSHYYIATEKVEAQKVLLKDITTYSKKQRLLLCKTIAHAVKGLHDAHIVHADIKENNILLKQTRTGSLIGKIIDFDCSFFESDPPKTEDELGGDQVYLAPEACQFICGEEVELSCKIDVFALGLLFHQYLTGELPEFDTNEYDYAFEAVLDDQKLQVSPELPEKMQSMLNGMLEGDPKKRLSMDRVYRMFDGEEKKKNPTETENAVSGRFNEKVDGLKKDDPWFFNPGDL